MSTEAAWRLILAVANQGLWIPAGFGTRHSYWLVLLDVPIVLKHGKKQGAALLSRLFAIYPGMTPNPIT